MKAVMLIVVYLLLGGCGAVFVKSEIEIMTTPAAKVYIDEREIGKTETNFKMTDIKPGKVKLKLVSEGSGQIWEKELNLNNLTTTIVSYHFADDQKYSWGYVMYPEKTGKDQEPAIIVNSKPADASVKLDGQIIGRTPTKLEQVAEGDRHLVISYPGFESQNLFVKTKNGYQIVVDIQLPETKIDIPKETNPDLTEPTEIDSMEKVLIEETGTGWLRVRNEASTAGLEVGKVDVGKKYELLETDDSGWYKIKVDENVSGWISAQFAKIVAVSGQ